MPAPLHLRVFISSPGDVADERNSTRSLLKDELPYDPFIRGKVTLDPVSWDDPAAPTPMVATLTPQEAVNRFGCRPSECDIVIVILWSRLGTHLDLSKFQKPNGEPYLSGTEYEYEDAASAQKLPDILVYRRTDNVLLDPDDPQFEVNVAQRRKARAFFDRFKNPDGSFRGGFTDYKTTTEFVGRLGTDLKAIIHNKLLEVQSGPATVVVEPPKEPSPIWPHSPYPGLRPFDITEEAIFFGRRRETDALIARLRDPHQRFLAVVGASGSGKSSLVRAGLLPRLRQGAVEGSAMWPVVLFKPGDNPFSALASALEPFLPQGTVGEPNLAKALANTPADIIKYADQVLTKAPTSARLFLFIDQLEELFTQTPEDYHEGFVDLLWSAANEARAFVLATLRADFVPEASKYQRLADMLRPDTGIFSLFPPGHKALTDMISLPAKRAGVELEDELVSQILGDADPNALPLVAFCLKELYQPDGRNTPANRMTIAAYEDMGGLYKAIGKHAESLLETWQRNDGANIDATMATIFEALVTVDINGTAFRRRARRNELQAVNNLVEQLISGRLLIGAKSKDGSSEHATVELADEALCDSWPRLKDWIVRNRSEKVLRAELEHDVGKWRQAHDNGLLWRGRRLKEAERLFRCEPSNLQSSDITVDDVRGFIRASISRRWKSTALKVAGVSVVSVVVITLGILIWFFIERKDTPMPVNSFEPNSLKLHDMLGNVWEWTDDCHVFSGLTDPSAPGRQVKVCLARGGSWDNYEEWKVHPAYHLPLDANHRGKSVGFRVARKVDNDEQENECFPDCPKLVILGGAGVKFATRAPGPSETAPSNLCKEDPQGEPEPLEEFAIGQDEVTVADWAKCSKDEDCRPKPWLDGRLPVTDVSWYDAKKYVQWLNKRYPSRPEYQYRLPSRVEWEYAARGGNDTTCEGGNWLNEIRGKANCDVCEVKWKQFRYWLGVRVKLIFLWLVQPLSKGTDVNSPSRPVPAQLPATAPP